MTAPEQIVTIINRKGGSGKTTTTFQLAGVLLEAGQRVLIVDLDPQASLTRLLLDEPVQLGDGIGACLPPEGPTPLSRIRRTAIGADLLPGDRTIEQASIALLNYGPRLKRLRRVLGTIEGYDVILIDTPPTLDFATGSAILAARWAILPTSTAQVDLDALVDTIATIEDYEANEERCAAGLAIVPNGVKHNSVDRDAVALLRETYGDLVVGPVPHSVAILKSLNLRVPVCRSDPRNPALPIYRQLAEMVRRATLTREAVHA